MVLEHHLKTHLFLVVVINVYTQTAFSNEKHVFRTSYTEFLVKRSFSLFSSVEEQTRKGAATNWRTFYVFFELSATTCVRWKCLLVVQAVDAALLRRRSRRSRNAAVENAAPPALPPKRYNIIHFISKSNLKEICSVL